MVLRRLLPLLLAALAPCAFAQSSGEDAALADLVESLTSRSSEGLRPFTTSDGAVGLDLGDRFRHVHLAYNDGDGPVAACVGSLGEANAFLGRDLRTGQAWPRIDLRSTPPDAEAQAALHGMSAAEYSHYWNLIEQAKALRPGEAPEAVTITIVNNDGAGEGFNDPTLVSPEGGNTGTTRGAQRLIVFDFAADIWGAFLDSSVAISVASEFNSFPGQCSPGGGILGFAGSAGLFRDFPGAELPGTFYPVALANKQSGVDINGATAEINATFNSDVDTGCLGAGIRFYYGLDNSTPAGTLNLLIVVLHELGHGLGSLSFVDPTTGSFAGGFPDVWSRFMFDRDVGLTWNNMSAAQRVASAINTGDLLWDGPNTKIASGFLVAGRDPANGRVQLFAPNPLQQGSSVSHWDSAASPNLLMEPAITPGLPLTLDLSRQQMRDIGWYRDQNLDRIPDTITNVQPSGGSVNAGANVNITWTNTGGFNRNVTIELSTDGGATFPTTIAQDVANTGTRAWTVPNTPTSSARIRVREHDFVAPAGVSTSDFTIGGNNTAPSFTPAVAVTRQRGSPGGAAVTVGTVADAQTPAGSLSVTQVAGGSATGITVSSITNNAGTISAVIAASCTASAGTVRFQVSDGDLSSTGDFNVNVSANSAPTLGTYPDAGFAVGAGGTVTPSAAPSDNGSVASVSATAAGFSGTFSGNPITGVITVSNAGPAGSYPVSVIAVDNCNATTVRGFTLTVGNTLFANGFE